MAAVVGLASCLFSLDVGVIPTTGINYFVIAVVAVMVGGNERWTGWVAGGLLLGIAQTLVAWQLSVRWTEALTFAVLIAALWWRPRGLIQAPARIEEL